MGIGGSPGYRRATVVGGGVIGISWTALFLARGLEVTVCDPLPDVADRVRVGLGEIAPTLAQLGLPVDDLTDGTDALRFDPEVASAVAGADVVQENGPERAEVKQPLWSAIEAGARRTPCLPPPPRGSRPRSWARPCADPAGWSSAIRSTHHTWSPGRGRALTRDRS